MDRTALSTHTQPPHGRVLGAVGIYRPGSPVDELSGGTAIAFAALVATRTRGVSYDELADLYWPDVRPAHWHGLVSFHQRWLERRLPQGWHVEEANDVLTLTIDRGGIDAWTLTDRFDTHLIDHEIELLLGTPYPGLPMRGILAASAERLRHHQELLQQRAGNTYVSLLEPARAHANPYRCSQHHSATQDLSDMTTDEPFSLITQIADATSDALAPWRSRLEATATQHDHFVDGGGGAAAEFADLALTFTQIRWDLLEIRGRTRQARAAQAWRLLQDHLLAGTTGGPQRVVIFQAHRLDAGSLEVVKQLVRFPNTESASLIVCGDPLDTETQWRELLCQLDRQHAAWFEPCLECDPILCSGRRVPENTGLCRHL